jgi:hypothetical protein
VEIEKAVVYTVQQRWDIWENVRREREREREREVTVLGESVIPAGFEQDLRRGETERQRRVRGQF